ncbi:MAG: 16S rRNA (cytidine(1402)-2'-O)-methyltransferase, partial [bacterium]
MARSRGILYVVATPIGNLQDLTQRAGEVLAKVELVAAEDTRRTRKLLTHLGIRVRLVSYREHNRDEAARSILAHLGAGRNAALVTDAGTPGVSDPGYHLVDACVKQGITVIPVPGASALAAALSVSGMPMDRFVFEGFLPSRAAARRRRLEELGATGLPFVAYESPRRIASTLSDIARTLGKVQVVVAREMTKVHEEFLRGDAQEVGRRLRE